MRAPGAEKPLPRRRAGSRGRSFRFTTRFSGGSRIPDTRRLTRLASTTSSGITSIDYQLGKPPSSIASAGSLPLSPFCTGLPFHGVQKFIRVMFKYVIATAEPAFFSFGLLSAFLLWIFCRSVHMVLCWVDRFLFRVKLLVWYRSHLNRRKGGADALHAFLVV